MKEIPIELFSISCNLMRYNCFVIIDKYIFTLLIKKLFSTYNVLLYNIRCFLIWCAKFDHVKRRTWRRSVVELKTETRNGSWNAHCFRWPIAPPCKLRLPMFFRCDSFILFELSIILLLLLLLLAFSIISCIISLCSCWCPLFSFVYACWNFCSITNIRTSLLITQLFF